MFFKKSFLFSLVIIAGLQADQTSLSNNERIGSALKGLAYSVLAAGCVESIVTFTKKAYLSEENTKHLPLMAVTMLTPLWFGIRSAGKAFEALHQAGSQESLKRQEKEAAQTFKNSSLMNPRERYFEGMKGSTLVCVAGFQLIVTGLLAEATYTNIQENDTDLAHIIRTSLLTCIYAWSVKHVGSAAYDSFQKAFGNPIVNTLKMQESRPLQKNTMPNSKAD